MCPHHRTLVSKLVLIQGNMVISCSSAFYPRTFCHTGMLFFFFFGKQETKSSDFSFLRFFCQLPIQLWDVPGSCEPDRGLDIDVSCPAQSSGTCPDQVPREVEEEMPSHASQLVLHWFQPTGHLVSSPCYAHSLVWEVETFCGIQHFFFHKPGCMKWAENIGWCVILCSLSTYRIDARKNQRCHLARIQWNLCLLKITVTQIHGDCWLWLQIWRIIKNATQVNNSA